MKSTTQSGLWTAGFGEVGATLKSFQDNGVTLEHMARIRSDADYARRVAEFMMRGGIDGSVHHKLARALMGKNFFGVEEWATLYNANFSKKTLREVSEFPWGEDVLNSVCPFPKCGKVVKDCHFAYLGLNTLNGKPVTILKLQELHPATGQPKFYSYAPSAWYSTHDFAKLTTLGLRWYLMHKEIVPKSTGENFEFQKGMLPAEYEVPLCIEEVTKDLLVSRKTGNFVNRSVYARCNDLSANGGRLVAGFCGEGGVGLRGWGGNVDDCDDSIGLAASRKFPS